jgi:hypothetical protein
MVLPDDDGVGFSRSISMKSLLSLISTFRAMVGSPIQLLGIILPARPECVNEKRDTP